MILDVIADRFVVAFQQAGFDYTGRVSVLVEYPVFSIPQGDQGIIRFRGLLQITDRRLLAGSLIMLPDGSEEMDIDALPGRINDPLGPDPAFGRDVGALAPDADAGVQQEDIGESISLHIRKESGLAAVGISDEHIDPVRGDVFLRRLQHLHRSGVGIVLHPGPDEESLRPVPQVLVVKQDVPGHIVVALLKIRVAADIVKIQFPRIFCYIKISEHPHTEIKAQPEFGTQK